MLIGDVPTWIREMDDGMYYDGCESEDDWIQALECGTFADAWRIRCAIAQRQLFDDMLYAGVCR